MSIHHCLRRLFLLFAPCFLFLSCQSGPTETTAPEGQRTVTFSVTNYRQISFDDLSSSGTSRATETIVMNLRNLSLTVFNAETNDIVVPTILHKSDDYENDGATAKTFPKFSVTLPYGRYRVLMLGYNGSRECNIASLNHLSWEEDYVPNTFLYCEEFTFNEYSDLTKNITLKRVVAAFRITAEDAIPAELKKMRFCSTSGGTVLDATTGFTPANNGRTSEITIPEDRIGKKEETFTVYLFLPEEQTTTNYTVQALTENSGVLNEKHFNNVPLRINYLTEWTGKLFEASGNETPDVQRGFNIDWDMDWAGTLTVGN